MIFAAFTPALLAALAAVIGLLVVGFYLLRPPPRRLAVSSNQIWDRVLKLKRTDNQRWRWWVSLLLSLLIAWAVAFALGQPEWSDQQGERRNVAIVIDTAPTMAAKTANAETRLDRAKRLARALIDSYPLGTRFLLADTTRSVGSPAFLEARDAIKVLDELKVSAGIAPRYPALDISVAVNAKREEVFFTDGVAGVAAPASVRVESVFEPANNVGITAFDVRTMTVDPRRAEAFVELGNAGLAPVDAVVSIAGAGREPLQQTLKVPPRGFASHTFSLDRFSGGALRASVRAGSDALDIDNSAFAFLPLNRSLRVALVSTGGERSLERALRLDPRISLSVMSPKQYVARGGFDAFVFDRFAPPVAPAAPALLFQPARVSWLPAAETTLSQPPIEAWLSEHPVLENISFRDVQIQRSAAFGGSSEGISALVRSKGARALVVASDVNPRWVSVGFSVTESNFAEQPSFPMFLSNVLAWLTTENAPISKPIGTVVIPFERAKVKALEGENPSPRFVPRATLVQSDAPNFYTAESEGRRMRVLVNVLDPAITDINASALQATATASPAATSVSKVAMRWQPWIVLMLVAFVALVLEWMSYHRRVTL